MWYVHTDSNISFFLLLALTCALGTGIADIVLYKTMDGCDNGDPLGLNIHQYIYGRGIANIVIPGLIFLCITRFLSDTLTVQYLNRANNLQNHCRESPRIYSRDDRQIFYGYLYKYIYR